MQERHWAAIGKTLVTVLILGVAAAAIVVAMIIQRGVSARTAPTAPEAVIARAARRFAIPASARKMHNPIPLTPAVLADARGHYADHCAQCHANDGSGQTEMGQGLYPKAPDMRRPATQTMSDGEIFAIIQNGVRLTGMPAWGEPGEGEEESWKLVHFIRHLPKISPQEIEEIKRMNPISEHERQEQKEEHDFLEGDSKHEVH